MFDITERPKSFPTNSDNHMASMLYHSQIATGFSEARSVFWLKNFSKWWIHLFSCYHSLSKIQVKPFCHIVILIDSVMLCNCDIVTEIVNLQETCNSRKQEESFHAIEMLLQFFQGS